MSLAKVFSALSDANRQKILDLLKKSDLSVSKIHKVLKITMASVSHHLNALKRVNLIKSKRRGQQIIYSLNLNTFKDQSRKILKFLTI